MARIDAILKMVKEQGASDLHISTGAPPMLRVFGEMRPVESPELTGEQARQLLYEMMSPEQRAQFERERDIDFAYDVPGEVRVRCNLFEQIRGIAGAFRLLPTQIYTLDQLGLPDAIRRFGRDFGRTDQDRRRDSCPLRRQHLHRRNQHQRRHLEREHDQ